MTIDVTEVLKGSISGARIVLKQAGGIVGDIGMSVSGQATFSMGEEVLVFAEVRPRDSTLYTTALWQGKWLLEIDAATGARVAVQQDASIRNGSSEMARLDFGALRESVARRAALDVRTYQFDAVPAETPAGSNESAFTLFTNPAKWRTLPARMDVLWKFELPESAFEATAVIDGGLVFVGDLDGGFHALDFDTGVEKWSHASEAGFKAPAGVRDGLVYVGDEDGQFYAIIRDCLVAYLQGHSAPIAVELARGNAPTTVQPTFHELDEVLNALPSDPLAA